MAQDIGVVEAKKETVNIIFIGHVDAGKSTIGGQLLLQTGMVDERTLEKYERESVEKNNESLRSVLDINQEERDKGITVEVGRASFDTTHKHIILMDAPGHKLYVPNMLAGLSQTDVAVLVISARRGEFETGFDRGGQTREHAMLSKVLGISRLIVLVNKMDDSTVGWSEERFKECKAGLGPYLRSCRFSLKTEVTFIPCSGVTGAFLKHVPGEAICPWYRGPSFLEFLDQLPPITRMVNAPFRMPISDKLIEKGGIFVFGKVESGVVSKNKQLILMPMKLKVEVTQLWSDEVEVDTITAGENVKIKLKGVEDKDLLPGNVLCDPTVPCKTANTFAVQVVLQDIKGIVTAGFMPMLHLHSSVGMVSVKKILKTTGRRDGKVTIAPRFAKEDQVAVMVLESAVELCVETYADFSPLGRFTLRDSGKTIGCGIVLKLKC